VASLLADLHGVVASQKGTAYSAFLGFGDSVTLVGGKTGTAQIRLPSRQIVIDRALVPAGRAEELIGNLAVLLGAPAAEIRARFAEVAADASFVLDGDISEAAASFIAERPGDFPGVVVESIAEVDTAWFVGVAPLDDPQYIVAVVIEEGGSGGKIAAPTARAILQFLMGEEVDAIRGGEEAD